MSLNVYFVIGLIVGITFGKAEHSDTAWPETPSDFKLIKDQDFDTYIELRYNGINWTMYESNWGQDPIKYNGTDMEDPEGFPYLIWPLKLNNMRVICIFSVFSDKIMLTSSTESMTIHIPVPPFESTKSFVYDKYLIVNDIDAYDLEKIFNNRKLLGANIPIKMISSLSKKAKKTIHDYTCVGDFNCAQNFDEPGEIITTENGVNEVFPAFKRHGVMLYSVREIFTSNERCHYSVKNMNTNQSWFIPQNLTVSNKEPEGIRTMLVPIIDGTENFFKQFPTTTTTQSTTTKLTQLATTQLTTIEMITINGQRTIKTTSMNLLSIIFLSQKFYSWIYLTLS